MNILFIDTMGLTKILGLTIKESQQDFSHFFHWWLTLTFHLICSLTLSLALHIYICARMRALCISHARSFLWLCLSLATSRPPSRRVWVCGRARASVLGCVTSMSRFLFPNHFPAHSLSYPLRVCVRVSACVYVDARICVYMPTACIRLCLSHYR